MNLDAMGRPIVPKEHGAWAVLYGAFLAGVGVAGRMHLPVLLLLVGITASAFANGALTILLRPAAGPAHAARKRRALAWSLVYGGLAVTALVPLLMVYRMTFLIPFAVGATFFVLLRALLIRGKDDRSLVGELLGTAGLSMVVAVTHAVSVSEVRPVGLILWVLVFLFFASAVFRVRTRLHGMFVRQRGVRAADPGRVQSVVYHIMLILVIPLLAVLHVIPWVVLFAFAPAVWRAASGLRDDGEAPLDVMRLGWSEVALTTAFVLLLIGAFHVGTSAG
ncbi:MAG TPA: YwiC-like family protein [Candidatus Methylomirabilis sp.]|nr:YwiC-like family protein [Candidatus Methylomirabilis sp.]